MISIFIPVKNEERNLPGCLQSVSWSDDVHVYDSGSTDASVTIAEAAGAIVTRRAQHTGELFGGDESAHKNWAMANLPFKYPWVFHLDADERATPELAANLLQAVRTPSDAVAYRVRRRDFWGSTWLKHAVNSSYYIRLFRPVHLKYERLVNPVAVPQGPVGELDGFLDHYPFSKGMEHWIDRHNAYSTLEARQIAKNRGGNQAFSVSKALFAKDRNERRFHQKEIFYRVPARPLLKFLLLYVGKRGFLDGRAGLHYAALQSFYELMIVLKSKQLSTARLHPLKDRPGAPEKSRAAADALYADQFASK